MIFYAWAGLAVQSVLVAGVIAFVLVGAAYQRSVIAELEQQGQAVQVTTTLEENFLDAQRAAEGYQATGQARFLRAYQIEQDQVEAELGLVRRLASAGVLGVVTVQARTARAAFVAYDQAEAAQAGSGTEARRYDRAAEISVAFRSQNDRLRRLLVQYGDVLTSRGERILGVGLGPASAVLAVGLMVPVIALAVGLRWVSGPLHAATTAVRERALGDTQARAVPSGPADVRDLALSINFLADENDRVQEAERERARLLAEVRQAAIRIREHLRGEAVIREAVTAIHEYLDVDFVWVGMVSGERLTLADGDPGTWGQVTDIVGYFPPDSVGWLRDVYRHRSSYRVQDLRASQAEEIPAEIKRILHGRHRPGT